MALEGFKADLLWCCGLECLSQALRQGATTDLKPIAEIARDEPRAITIMHKL